jgi:hypothetical protein
MGTKEWIPGQARNDSESRNSSLITLFSFQIAALKKSVPPYLHKPARFMRKSAKKFLGIAVKACGVRRYFFLEFLEIAG